MMKKIGMMMVAALVALTSVSCNETNTEYWSDSTFVKVEGTSGAITYRTDDGKMLTQQDAKVQMPTSLQWGDRMLILYSPVEVSQSYGGTYITLYGYVRFDYANTAVVQGTTTEYSNATLDIYDYNYWPNSIVHLTRDVLDISLIYYCTEKSTHAFTLVLDEQKPTTDRNYLRLEICHKSSATEETGKEACVGYYTFDFSEFADYIDSTEGVEFFMKGATEDETQTRVYPWSTFGL
ncbi:MAG: hypothetical protein IJ028_02610 [Alistipes sp.]|nr:hypothetical protein [Alistipes sp.]